MPANGVYGMPERTWALRFRKTWHFKALMFEDSKVKTLPQGYLAFDGISSIHRNNAQLPDERLTSKMTKGDLSLICNPSATKG